MSPSIGNSHFQPVEIWVEANEPLQREREPITCGIPWPRAMLTDPARLVLLGPEGGPLPLQTRILDRWPDGSVRWLLLDWQATVKGPTCYRVASHTEPACHESSLRIQKQDRRITVDTSIVQFSLRAGVPFLLEASAAENSQSIQANLAVDSAGQTTALVDSLEILEPGPLRAALRGQGRLVRDLDAKVLGKLDLVLHFFAGSPTVRFSLTIGNPQRASHPGGIWTLGDPGSVYFKEASLGITLPEASEAAILHCSTEAGGPFDRCELPFEIYQDSSGGDAWRSPNHRNQRGIVPNTFCGYRLHTGGKERPGRRATPIVTLERGSHSLGIVMPHFWQNFPKAIEADPNSLRLQLFPPQYAQVYELQGGEQKTHTFSVAFAKDKVTAEPLAWCRAPLLAHAMPAWYASANAVPYLIPKADDSNSDYLGQVDSAIDGDDTFLKKREVIDEYGWRHFGDIYADHEAVFHRGPMPLVSHYNNQYDALAGFIFQFLRSGDRRWWSLLQDLAAHVSDIDIYHTDQDRAAYNHGLFWHTIHYTDAGTSTHRTYPLAPGVRGGGPANEHNYTTGLMLHHFLTGDLLSRHSAIELAQWVLDMDDGTKTILRWLDRGDTGQASQTGSMDYHGPGRGAGNSINALLDGQRLTGSPRFLAKAEQLIRRCIHPADDIAARGLLDAERRWSYTVFLQALAKYLDYKTELGALDRMYAYARASLLHYARWMADHEYPYLEKPAILEYPTETWAAQDMRKSEVFQLAAKHASGAERERFLERSEFFFRYSTATLASMKTRTLARPVVLMLTNGFMHGYCQKHPEIAGQAAVESYDFGNPEVFVPQKLRARKRLFILIAVLAAAGILALLACWLRGG